MSNSTLAPSEKHLEDWIVANPKKFLPNHWLNQDRVTTSPFIEYIVARQVGLPYGIADLFVKARQSTYVIELKKGVIDAASIAQCLRYMECFNRIRMIVHIDLWHDSPGFRKPYENDTRGMIVGNSIADKHIPFICESLGIVPVYYDYIDGSYVFSPEYHWTLTDDHEHYKDRADGAIGDAMRQEMLERPAAAWREEIAK